MYLLGNSDPVDAHHSVFERLDHSGTTDAPSSTQHKTNATIGIPQQATNFEDQLHRVALTAVMECLQQQNTSTKKSAAVPTRRSQPELKQTTNKSGTFDKLTEINTSRERSSPSQPAKKDSAVSPSSIHRKVKLRMDTVSDTKGKGKSNNVMTRLGKQSVFTRLAN